MVGDGVRRTGAGGEMGELLVAGSATATGFPGDGLGVHRIHRAAPTGFYPPGAPGQFRDPVRRRRNLSAAGLALGLCLLAGGTAGSRFLCLHSRPPTSRSLEGFNSLYFSITTLATSGYGDIVPVSNLARMLAMTESMVGLFYVTLLIARLVSLYSSQGLSDDESDSVIPSYNRFEEPVDSPDPKIPLRGNQKAANMHIDSGVRIR